MTSLAIACRQARNGERGGVIKGVIAARLFYHAAAASILAYAGLGLALHSALLWPATVVHQVQLVWCFLSLLFAQRKAAKA